MQLANFIIFISSIVWILPVFRQYDTGLRYFFLVLGLSDPINILIVQFTDIRAGLVHSVAALLLLYSLNIDVSKKSGIIYRDFVILALFISALLIPNLFYLTLIIHLAIFSRILLFLLIKLHQETTLYIFYSILLFYELTVIIKLGIYLTGTQSGILLSYITLAFQIIIALFFIIFKENDPRLTYKLNLQT